MEGYILQGIVCDIPRCREDKICNRNRVVDNKCEGVNRIDIVAEGIVSLNDIPYNRITIGERGRRVEDKRIIFIS